MVNQMSALSPPGRIRVPNFPCVDPFLPLSNQNTYSRRLANCFKITCPTLMFTPTNELLRARCIVAKYRKNLPLPPCLTRQDFVLARTLFESSFHPITGEKLFVLSRICSQIPMKAILLGGIMTYYDYCLCPNMIPWTASHVLYQSYLALLNYSNRSYSHYSTISWVSSFVTGTGVAIGTHWYMCKKLNTCATQFLRRFIPLLSVGAATILSVPIMRMSELTNGIPVYYKNENFLGYSQSAACYAVASTTISRVLAIIPGMAISPFVMDYLYYRGFLCRYPWSILPINIGIMAVTLCCSIPMTCALFPQRFTVPINSLEDDLQRKAKQLIPSPKSAYYIKGN